VPASHFADRRKAIRAELAGLRVDALLVAALPNVRYLSGFTGSNAMLLVERSGKDTLFTDPRYDIRARSESDCSVRISKKSLAEDVVARLKRSSIRRLGFERTRLGYENWHFLNEKLPKSIKIEPLDALVEKRRMVKSAEEIEAIRRSVLLNSQAFDDTMRALKPDQTTENALAGELEYRMRVLGAEKASFETIVAAGPRSALPHAQPTQEVIGLYDLLLVDMGAFLDGYASDMTRVVAIGRAGTRLRKLHRAVLEAQLAAIDAVRPGVAASSIDRRARQVLAKHGMDRQFVHSTGHGLGLEIHEPPRLGKRDRTRLEEGMVITIEPGVYFEGYAGVRIEDTVVVTRGGCEILTPTPKTFIEI
jgi:Xaa-Pro aminopeptidase